MAMTDEERKAKKREYRKRMTAEQKERKRASDKAYRAANVEKVRASQKSWYEANKESVRTRDQARYMANKEIVKERSKAWGASNPGKVRAYRKATRESPEGRRKSFRYSIYKLYGMTPEAYDALVVASGGCCAACGRPDAGTRSRGLVLDHCHQTGRVRGLICHQCNTALGLLGESQERVAALASYIRREVIVEDWSI